MRKNPKKNCGKCKKKLIIFQHKCKVCSKYFHKKCIKNHNVDKDFICSACLNKSLPFFNLQNLEFLDDLKGKPKFGNYPSFNIQSLLDELKRNESENNEFIGETLKSTYYDPDDFIKAKFSNKLFSIVHLNIASLAAHLDELINLLSLLNHEFDIITLTETRIKQTHPSLINIELPGYHFFETATKTNAGGSLIFIKNEYSSKLLPEYSKSVEGIF